MEERIHSYHVSQKVICLLQAIYNGFMSIQSNTSEEFCIQFARLFNAVTNSITRKLSNEGEEFSMLKIILYEF